MKRNITRIGLLLSLLATGCGGGGGDGDGGGDDGPDVASIVLAPSWVRMLPRGTHQLAVTVTDTDGKELTDRAIRWSSSDPSTASVSSTGLVTGVATGGPAVISASYDGKTAQVAALVLEPVRYLIVSPDDETIPLDSTLQMNAVPHDKWWNALLDRPVTWSSSNPQVATVDGTGLVTAVAIGDATITGVSEGIQGTAPVTVVRPVQGMATAGLGHACGLTVLGKAYCWGNTIAIGDGGITRDPFTPFPKAVWTSLKFVSLAAGGYHTCGLTPAGDAYCWGSHEKGQLGDGTTAGDTDVPVLVTGGLKFASVSTGGKRSGGLTTDGLAYIWGESAGVTADGGRMNTNAPVAVPGGRVFTSVSVGALHACGITATNDAHCWGWNDHGQLGSTGANYRSTPAAVTGGLKFAAISAGHGHTCGITAAGSAYCWGDNESGQLGVGTSNDFDRTAPVAVAGTQKYRSISAGHGMTVAISTSGGLLFWGSTSWGCSANASGPGPNCGELHSYTPKSMGAHESAAAGGGFAIALRSSGVAYGFGNNESGQLGDGTNRLGASSPVAANADYTVEGPDSTLNVDPGNSEPFVVSVWRTGGFSTAGIGYTGPITLSMAGLPEDVTAAFIPATLSNGMWLSSGTLTAGSTATPQNVNATIRATGVDRTRTASMSLSLGDGGGELNLVCPDGEQQLPTGYHCMTNSGGDHVPGKYAIPEMHGTWVDEGAGLCITWNSNGQATGRYSGTGIGGGEPHTTPSGEWGVIVKRSGLPEGTETQWYVFTEMLDDQTVLLSYDSAKDEIIGWAFDKKACPW